jgi:hypothetical protein
LRQMMLFDFQTYSRDTAFPGSNSHAVAAKVMDSFPLRDLPPVTPWHLMPFG